MVGAPHRRGGAFGHGVVPSRPLNPPPPGREQNGPIRPGWQGFGAGDANPSWRCASAPQLVGLGTEREVHAAAPPWPTIVSVSARWVDVPEPERRTPSRESERSAVRALRNG